MKILFGYINLDEGRVDPAVLDRMAVTLKDYKHDAAAKMTCKNVAAGFLSQYDTEESKYDTSPLYDRDSGLFFLCDAILDNRDELIDALGLRDLTELSDGMIIFEAYKKWREDCAARLLGDFAFVVYDKKKNRACMFRDHMGKRTIYYRLINNTLFFSTLFKPLIDPYGAGSKAALNERYLVEFLSLSEIRHDLTPRITIFEDVYYVLPGGFTSVREAHVEDTVYWDPAKLPVNKKTSEKDYIAEFKSIFFDSVKCRLRTSGEVGVLLSGGLDSSAVACAAASILKDQGKYLYTYTSVPLKGFKNWAQTNICPDESRAVHKMCGMYPNMKTHFIDSAGLNSVNIIDTVLAAVEQPYKYIENSAWLNDIYEKAEQDGCRILLSGINGNMTISFGVMDFLLAEHILRLDFKRFIQDFTSFCLRNHIGRKKYLFWLARAVSGYLVRFFKKTELSSPMVKYEFREKYGVEATLKSVGYTSTPIVRHRKQQLTALHTTFRNHMNSVNSKTGLFHNVCERDPTGDKRIVEFCLQLPYHLYFYEEKGLDRGLVRKRCRVSCRQRFLKNSAVEASRPPIGRIDRESLGANQR
jgi:asparagine synthase (glutamine-hydrolysing)